ncbi:MAG: polyprenyl synthetase family protein [Paramuribaculum sp.]|nr:polyprenyl synthetase family protein [Paramuribaculum sp.]
MKTLDEYTSIADSIVSNISLPKEPEGLYAPIRYALSTGGKRIRPVLTLATAEATGGSYETAISQAIGVELFHNFTLLHDDVMDHSDMRRGRPTVHKKWNETTAILSGDAMFSLCTLYLTSDFRSEKSMEILSLFYRTAMEVYDGQQYDMDFEQRTDVTVEEYLNMIRLKTSVLLGCASAMGAILTSSSAQTIDAFYHYGEKLGMAFQLRDDYLDTFGDQEIFGKRTGNDILSDKKTWLLIKAIEKDSSGTALSEIQNPSAPEVKYQKIKGLYLDLGLNEECMSLIKKYSLEAIECLQDISLSEEAATFFKELALSTANRDK